MLAATLLSQFDFLVAMESQKLCTKACNVTIKYIFCFTKTLKYIWLIKIKFDYNPVWNLKVFSGILSKEKW